MTKYQIDTDEIWKIPKEPTVLIIEESLNTRDFLYNEPPSELKSILPPATFAQLTAIHQDQALTIPQKMAKIDAVINALPEDVLEQLPLPPAFRLLPENVQKMMKAIRTAKNLTMQEKWLQMTIIIESLPNEQRQMLQQTIPHFPSEPPPELRDVLPKDAWNQLVAVYQDVKLNNVQKMERIDKIMDSLPDSIRQQLSVSSSPLQKLPIDIQQKLQAIHMEEGLSVEQRFQKMNAIIESLPLEMKKLIMQR
uniref:MgtE_N domain-containing protein n=1 Tax=Elaeophora elaphi TaxID=1147741 RepID=A0A0R3RXP6_9BILA